MEHTPHRFFENKRTNLQTIQLGNVKKKEKKKKKKEEEEKKKIKRNKLNGLLYPCSVEFAIGIFLVQINYTGFQQ
jgi:hypothetical protein